jgi:membrane fusion protein, multidrug efflux system
MDETPKPILEQSEKKTYKRYIWGWIFAGFILSAGIYLYFLYETYYPSTDDAYVQAHTINIAANVSGPITDIYVSNNQYVVKNEVLFQIDKRPFEAEYQHAESNLQLAGHIMFANLAAIEIARANFDKTKAQLIADEKNYRRISTLVEKGQASLQSGDEAKAREDTALALTIAAKEQLNQAIARLGGVGNKNPRILQAKAKLEIARLNLEYTTVKAPSNGFIVNFSLRPGGMVKEKQTLFQFIDNHQWYLYANYKETDMARIKEGQSVSIDVDMYPNKHFHGYVDSVSRASGAVFSLLPPENATGNWIKVTQRFPVKIIITDPDPRYPLRVGASCFVRINTLKKYKTASPTPAH